MSFALTGIEPARGPSQGGNVVRLAGMGIVPTCRVWLGGVPARVLLTQDTACYALAPAHDAGVVDVEMTSNGTRRVLEAAYRFARADLARESDLTRLVRALLRQLKMHVSQNTTLTVDVNYAGAATTEGTVEALANLPTLLLTGPDLHENRALTTNVGCELTDSEGTYLGYAPPYTVDLAFNLVGASASTVELLNLLSATIVFLQHTGHVAILRDPAMPDAGWVQWPVQQTGDTRTHFDGPDGVKTFSCNFIVQGVDLNTTHPLAAASPVNEASLRAASQGEFI